MEWWSTGVMEYWLILGYIAILASHHSNIPALQHSILQKIYRRMLTLIIKPMANIMVAKADPP
jgi:hypothetical protein